MAPGQRNHRNQFGGRRRAFMQPGFIFPKGEIFANTPVAVRVLDAIVGQPSDHPDPSPAALRQRAGARLVQVYSALLAHDGLYVAARGGDAFWAAASESLNSPSSPSEAGIRLDAADLKILVERVVEARRAFDPNLNPTQANSPRGAELKAIVDQWINLVDQVAALPAATTFKIAVGLGAPASRN
jgi:hypothetical protein